MIKKRTFLVVIGLICLAVVLVTYVNTAKSTGTTLNYELGQKWKELISRNNDKIIMTVNGTPVTQVQLESKINFLKAQQADASEEAARQSLIKQIVLRQEAEERGISVSLQEAEAFADTIKKDLLANPDIPGAKETLEYITASGQSVDEFFKAAVPNTGTLC